MHPRTSPALHTYHPSFHSPNLLLDHLAALTNTRPSGRYLRIPCPAHRGTNPSLALWVNVDGIGERCHSAGCSYAEIAAAIADSFGISIGRQHRRHDAPIPGSGTTRRLNTTPKTRDLRSYALRLWHNSVPIPNSPEHPSRLWLASRHLWRPEMPLPHAKRWIGAQHLHNNCTAAGAVIAIAAPPTAWLEAWPNLPDLSCVQLIYVAEDGNPERDRGLTKRTYAATQDSVVVLGCPLLEQTSEPVDVAEGLADALALASRSPAPAVATLGTSGMTSDVLASWLATAPATHIWADRDEAKHGRPPPGQRYGRQLLRLVEAAGGKAQAMHAQDPHKDPAAAAAALGFNILDPAWMEYARTLADMQPDWPRWEVARQATAMCAMGG